MRHYYNVLRPVCTNVFYLRLAIYKEINILSNGRLFFCFQDWDARFMIERSRAIKCPTVQYHLAGTKKVQQVGLPPILLKNYVPGDRSSCSNHSKRTVFQKKLHVTMFEDTVLSGWYRSPGTESSKRIRG